MKLSESELKKEKQKLWSRAISKADSPETLYPLSVEMHAAKTSVKNNVT